jgi:SAM-dependent methyltransferase
VLDSGCGTGENALHLAALGHAVLGVDFAAAAIERAAAKAADRHVSVEFQVADALDLAALGRSFDTIIDIGLFHTLEDGDRTRYAASLRAALRPGGRASLLCWSDRNPFGRGPRRVARGVHRARVARDAPPGGPGPRLARADRPVAGRDVILWSPTR